jgi:hypothetical protein
MAANVVGPIQAAFQSVSVDSRLGRSRRRTVFIRTSIPVEIKAW